MRAGDICACPVGIHLQNRAVCQIPGQLDLLSFPGLIVIANGDIPQGMILVKLAGQQIADPIQILGIVHRMAYFKEMGCMLFPCNQEKLKEKKHV